MREEREAAYLSPRETAEAATAVQDFADGLEAWLGEGMGLTLTGNVGTGKTHIAAALIKLACGLGIEGRFLTMDALPGRIKATCDRTGTTHRRMTGERETDVLEELAAVPLLALDDLGTENSTSWARDRFYTLVNRRYLARRPTIVTTKLID